MIGTLDNFFAPSCRIAWRRPPATIPPGSFRSRRDHAHVRPVDDGADDDQHRRCRAVVRAQGQCAGRTARRTDDQLCGFKERHDGAHLRRQRAYDIFTVTNVQDSALHLQHHNDRFTGEDTRPARRSRRSSAHLLPATTATETFQLMHYDGDQPTCRSSTTSSTCASSSSATRSRRSMAASRSRPSERAVDDLRTEAAARRPSGGFGRRRELHVHLSTASTPAPRLPALGRAGQRARQADRGALTDGPWCPTADIGDRYDADLLRVRKVGVTLRVQVAAAALRGPAGVLFRPAARSPAASAACPDQEIRFEVTPRNLNLGR